MSQTCQSCGAPDNGNEVMCGFCGKAYSQEISASAVSCPQCRTPNRGGRPHCVRCNAWLVMACLFCGAASPCSAMQCPQCHEIFEGMQERKQARDREQQTKSVIDGVVSVVGSIAGAVSGHPTQTTQPQYQQPQYQQPSPQYQQQQQSSSDWFGAGGSGGGDPSAPKMPSR